MNAVAVMGIGEYGKQLLGVSGPVMRRYADNIGADLVVLTENKIKTPYTTAWPCGGNKFQIVDLLNGKYDRVFLVDADCILSPACPDIFAEIVEDAIGVSVIPESQQRQMVIKMLRELGYGGVIDPQLDAAIISGGMLVCSRMHREIMNVARLLYLHRQWLNEEPCVHFVLRASGVKLKLLSPRHNVLFVDYPEFDKLPDNHILKRINAQHGSSFKAAWRQAYSVHYTLPAEIGNVTRRLQLMFEGRKYFYGR